MKYLPLLGALLLCANPVVAGDFVYVECDATLLTKVIDPETSKVLDSFPESDTKVYKIDTKNSTIENKNSFFAPYRDQAVSVEISKGQITYNANDKKGGFVAMKLKFNPPGKISGKGGGNMLKSGKTYKVKMSLNGSCSNADASTYLNQ